MVWNSAHPSSPHALSPSFKKLPALSFTQKITRPETRRYLSLPLSELNYETKIITELKISVRFGLKIYAVWFGPDFFDEN